jgi:CHAT domain-containing protein/tetratricopeptide (TPR) repeat protein
MTKVVPKVGALLFVVLLLSLPKPGGAAGSGAPGDPAEYMFYQYPDVALVVKVDVAEAEFSMRILGPDAALLAEAGVPGRRLGPIFQYLAPDDLPRQLMIEVTPGRPLPRSAIAMQVIQLDFGDPNADALARAYRLFSTGTKTAHGGDANTWVVKTYSLRDAAQNFAALGMEEMRLWSDYFAALLMLHRLGDRLSAVEFAREIQRAAARAGFDRVELAALVLEGDALMELIEGSEPQQSRSYFERARTVFAGIADRAGRQQYAGEQGRALYRMGQVLEREGRPEEALDMYSRAIEVTVSAGAPDLLTQLRNASAALQEALGRTAGAIEMLDQLAAELAEGELGDTALELADGLFDKGRLLNNNYRYAEAAAELARALELQQSAPRPRPWGPTGLELAWSLYSMGEAEAAAALIRESLPRTPLQDNRELLARAYGSLARISLARGNFGEAGEARRRQADLTEEGTAEANLLFHMAADARLRSGSGSAEAERLLRRSRQSAAAAGDLLAEQRAGLQLCLLTMERDRTATCSGAESDLLYKALREAGLPRLAVEAALARSGILRSQGKTGAAWQEMDGLLEDLYWLRQALPGVLGAWYVEHRASIYRDYLAIAVAVAGPPPRGSGNAAGPLLALERVRMLEATGALRAEDRYLEAASEDKLRSLLARREAVARAGSAALGGEARQALAAARRDCRGCGAPERGLMTAEQLESLLAGLGRTEAVLAYDFSGSTARALLAGRSGVRIVELSRSSELSDGLAALREEVVRDPGPGVQGRLDSLGQKLLAPLGDALPQRVYLLLAGPLQGIPFDALRLGGRFLADRHQVVNLAGLSALARRGVAMAPGYRDHVFLAGDPRRERDPFSLEVVISPEVAAVTDAFVGPGLHVVQGLALQKDEFLDDRFTGAALIHLAAPGRLELTSPDRSYLTLSGGTGISPENTLSPAEVRAFDLAASLVVLSRTVAVGECGSAVCSRMPMVAEFLDAGAASVLVSLWPVAEADAASFATDFYRHIGQEPDIESAFAVTRQSRIASAGATNLESWAGFQLFIR